MNETINNSNFFTNRNGNTLMKEFEGVLQHNNHIKNLDAVVGLNQWSSVLYAAMNYGFLVLDNK